MLYILYQSPWPIGGGTTYTAHLCRTLEHHGVDFRVVRIGKRNETFERPVGDYGFSYANRTLEELEWLLGMTDCTMLMTMGDPKMDENAWERLARYSNFWAVFHDPNEFRQFTYWKHFSPKRAITIRQHNVVRHMPQATYIPHPYVRAFADADIADIAARKRLACTVARVCSSKNANWILQANDALPERNRVALLGAWDRMWWLGASKRWPHVVPGKGYPRQWGAAATLCKEYRLMVDMTVFKDDGGDTQYAMLEAMDGGAVPVITEEWASYPGPARSLGLLVKDAEALTALLRRPPPAEELQARQEHNLEHLRTVHDPDAVAAAYCAALGVEAAPW